MTDDIKRLAEGVMGWTVGDTEVPHERDDRPYAEMRWWDGDNSTEWMAAHHYGYYSPRMWRPDIDIKAAMMLAVKLEIGVIPYRGRWMAFLPDSQSGYISDLAIDIRPDITAEADTAPQAIAAAALKWLEAQ